MDVLKTIDLFDRIRVARYDTIAKSYNVAKELTGFGKGNVRHCEFVEQVAATDVLLNEHDVPVRVVQAKNRVRNYVYDGT